MPRLDPRLAAFARTMRREPTPFEAQLWRALSGSKLNGLKFRRQAVIDGTIADFFCPALGLIVEVDGGTHDPQRDPVRDAAMARRGFRVLRFTNAQVAGQLDMVVLAIQAAATQQPGRWNGGIGKMAPDVPTPDPSPEPKAAEGQREGGSL